MEQIGYIKFGRLAWQFVCVKIQQFKNGMWDFGVDFNVDEVGGSCRSFAPFEKKAIFKTRRDAVSASLDAAMKFINDNEKTGSYCKAMREMVGIITEQELAPKQLTLF